MVPAGLAAQNQGCHAFGSRGARLVSHKFPVIGWLKRLKKLKFIHCLVHAWLLILLPHHAFCHPMNVVNSAGRCRRLAGLERPKMKRLEDTAAYAGMDPLTRGMKPNVLRYASGPAMAAVADVAVALKRLQPQNHHSPP